MTGMKVLNRNRLQLQVKMIDVKFTNGTLTRVDYTEETWLAFLKAVVRAEALLKNRNATQKDLDTAADVLRNAYEGLQHI